MQKYCEQKSPKSIPLKADEAQITTTAVGGVMCTCSQVMNNIWASWNDPTAQRVQLADCYSDKSATGSLQLPVEGRTSCSDHLWARSLWHSSPKMQDVPPPTRRPSGWQEVAAKLELITGREDSKQRGPTFYIKLKEDWVRTWTRFEEMNFSVVYFVWTMEVLNRSFCFFFFFFPPFSSEREDAKNNECRSKHFTPQLRGTSQANCPFNSRRRLTRLCDRLRRRSRSVVQLQKRLLDGLAEGVLEAGHRDPVWPVALSVAVGRRWSEQLICATTGRKKKETDIRKPSGAQPPRKQNDTKLV